MFSAPYERRAMNTKFETPTVKAVILAAGVGSRLSPLTSDCPKCLLHVGGVAILERMIRGNLARGVTEFVIVLGYLDERVKAFVNETFPDLNAEFVLNKSFRRTNTGYSLLLAEPHCRDCDFIKYDADVVFEDEIISRLLESKNHNCLCIDRNMQLNTEEVKVIVGAGNRVFKANKTVSPEKAVGESIGIEKISRATAKILFAELKLMMSDLSNYQEYYESAYERLIAKGVEFHTVDVTGLKWTEIDTREDFEEANSIFA